MSNQSTLSPAQFKKIQTDTRYKVIDVRSPSEHAGGSATPYCLPITELNAHGISQFTKQHGLEADQTLVLLCASGKRAEQAANTLKKLLPNPVAILAGGLSALNNENDQPISIERQVRIAAGLLVFIAAIASLLIHSAFVYLCLFVGAGLIFAGISNWCGMGVLLMKMPWNKK